MPKEKQGDIKKEVSLPFKFKVREVSIDQILDSWSTIESEILKFDQEQKKFVSK